MATVKEWEDAFDLLSDSQKEEILSSFYALCSWEFMNDKFPDVHRLYQNLWFHNCGSLKVKS